MEKNKNSFREEDFVKKYLQELPLEETSEKFTALLMGVILKEKRLKIFQNQPLISKPWWLAITVFVSACLFVVFKFSENNFLTFSSLDFNFLQKIALSNLFASFSISSSLVYIFGFFTLMIFVQLVFLKNYLNKRYSL